MRNYFIDFYGLLKYGFLGIIVNYTVAILVPVLFTDVDVRNVKQMAALALKIVLSMALMQLLCAFHYALIGERMMSQFCGWVLTAVCAPVFCKYNPFTRLTMGVSYSTAIALVLLFCFALTDLVGDIYDIFVLIVFMHFIMMTACVLFFKAFSIKSLPEPTLIGVGMVCAVSAGGVTFWSISNAFSVSAPMLLTIGLILLTLLLLAYYNAYAITRNFNDGNKRRAEQLMRETDEHMLRMSESNLESMRRLRHELKNQYAYMNLLLEKGDYGKLSEYFGEYSGKINETLAYVDCGNEVVSAVLNIGLSKAKQADAKLSYIINVPARLKIADADVCSLLLNLISNALEYLQRRRGLSDRAVTVRLELINRTLFVSVSNALDESDRDYALTLATSKRDRTLHGYGSKVVRAIADKYNGSVSYDAADGKFVVTAILSESDDPTENGQKE